MTHPPSTDRPGSAARPRSAAADGRSRAEDAPEPLPSFFADPLAADAPPASDAPRPMVVEDAANPTPPPIRAAPARLVTPTFVQPSPTPEPAASPAAKPGVCPFCGAARSADGPPTEARCPRCTIVDDAQTRAVTRRRAGPWFVYQDRVPSAPGMNFRTLLALTTAGRVAAGSVVRGPTTGHLWRPAEAVRGLARALGRCYACDAPVRTDAVRCPRCRRDQRPPSDPDAWFATEHADDATPDGPATAPATRRTAAQQEPIPLAPRAAPTPVKPGQPGQPVKSASPAVNGSATTPAGAILSAKELAAAFRLATAPGFDPDDPATARRRPTARRRLGGIIGLATLALAGGLAGLWAYPPTRPDVEHAARAVRDRVAEFVPAIEF